MPYSRRGADDQSNYQRETMVLSVILSETYTGHTTLYEHGFCQLHYDLSYKGPSLSVRMPSGGSPFGENEVRPWVEGLLPDNIRVRQAMAHTAKCNPANPFELLAYFGRDCPGAVQILTPQRVRDCTGRERRI